MFQRAYYRSRGLCLAVLLMAQGVTGSAQTAAAETAILDVRTVVFILLLVAISIGAIVLLEYLRRRA